ncbi:MAG: hypothetical protein CFE32_05680 [Alphaproteobacteria bacterium PA3]|nr:MAG: hypothetical protein CFE32_05680 [Alphaproteobacteria bacterium PA3]
MTHDETARARIDALLGEIAALRATMYRHIKDSGLSRVPEADIPEAWLSLLDDRHPGAARKHRYDGERMTLLHALLHDMDGLVSLHSLGQELDHPPANDPDMPRLEDWFPAIVPEETEALALIGTVTGHPRLSDGRPIVTSNVVVLNVDAGLARTMSRWYRLGGGSNMAKLVDQQRVGVRPGIRQASEAEVRRMTGEMCLRIQEATSYLVRAGLLK